MKLKFWDKGESRADASAAPATISESEPASASPSRAGAYAHVRMRPDRMPVENRVLTDFVDCEAIYTQDPVDLYSVVPSRKVPLAIEETLPDVTRTTFFKIEDGMLDMRTISACDELFDKIIELEEIQCERRNALTGIVALQAYAHEQAMEAVRDRREERTRALDEKLEKVRV